MQKDTNTDIRFDNFSGLPGIFWLYQFCFGNNAINETKHFRNIFKITQTHC